MYKIKNSIPLDGQVDLLTAGALTRSERDVLEELRSIEATTLTPLDALNKLYSLQQKLK